MLLRKCSRVRLKRFDIKTLQKYFLLKPTQVILLSFIFMILLGTGLLMLPISTTDAMGLHPIDALFISTSASCVTGLTVVDLKNDLTVFGKIVMLLLIQVGGLGIMTLATLAAHSMGYRFKMRQNLILQESLNQKNQSGLLDLIKCMLKYTFAIEGFFAILLTVHFFPEFGLEAIGYGIFHSVSAFCNAGFDLFGNYDSLCKRNDDNFLLMCIGTLIVLGGIGFTVMADFLHRRSFAKFSLHTKIVVITTAIMIVAGTLPILVVEFYNPHTIGNMNEFEKIVNSCFMSISCRTAGFNSFDLSETGQISQLVMVLLMFIGASPLSTGGGIKCTTFFIIVMSIWAVLRGKNNIVIFGREIPTALRDQSFAIFSMGAIWVIVASIILSIIDGERHELLEVIFETVSGFGTVGMGIGITNEWNYSGKLVLSLTMLVGRVGIMTFMLALIAQKNTAIKYPKENIMIG